MNPFSLFVVYLLIWWVTLFAVLPIGVRGQAEEGEVVRGSEPVSYTHLTLPTILLV